MARILGDPSALIDALRSANGGHAWRGEPVARKVAHAQRLGLDVAPSHVDEALERIIDSSDLLPGLWVRRAAEVAESIALVEAPGGVLGTGFLVSPWLLLTNNHVVESAEQAADTDVRFRYVAEDASGNIKNARRVRTDPQRFFASSPSEVLDFSLVALEAVDGKAPGEEFGWIPLIGATGKILLGQPVNVIQHPDGRPREVAVRNNLLLNIEDERKVAYATDTERGSSGSPVFNDGWELVALHHTAVPAVDEQGRPIDRNGDPVTARTPEHLRHWRANAGIRVSALVAHLQQAEFDADQQALVNELLA